MRRKMIVLTLAALTVPAVAHADFQIQREGPHSWPSKHELSAHVGYQAGIGGNIGNPPGFKIFAEYAYRFAKNIWFDLQINQVLGLGSGGGVCFDRAGTAFSCPNKGGYLTEAAAGVKFKWLVPTVPVVIEVPLAIGVSGFYGRDCGDNGAALVVRPGTSVRYFVTKNIGVGAGFNFALGPGFHGAGRCKGAYTDFYGAFDVQLGAEFVLN